MLRAIYVGDILFSQCPVFEFDPNTGQFHMIEDRQIAYDFEIVMNDDDFIVFATDGNSVYQIEVKNKSEEYK